MEANNKMPKTSLNKHGEKALVNKEKKKKRKAEDGDFEQEEGESEKSPNAKKSKKSKKGNLKSQDSDQAEGVNDKLTDAIESSETGMKTSNKVSETQKKDHNICIKAAQSHILRDALEEICFFYLDTFSLVQHNITKPQKTFFRH